MVLTIKNIAPGGKTLVDVATLPVGEPGRVDRTWSQGFYPGTGGDPDVWLAMRWNDFGWETIVEASNGAVGQDGKARDTLDPVNLVLESPTGIIAIDPRPFPSVFPPQRAQARTLFIPARKIASDSSGDNERTEALQIAAGTLRPLTLSNFGPAGMRLPALQASVYDSLKQKASVDLVGLNMALANHWPYQLEDYDDSIRLEPIPGWRPHGPVDRAAVGGTGIQHWTGYQQSVEYARVARLVAILAMEREWVHYRANGVPCAFTDYGPVSPMYSPGTPDPNNHTLPEWRHLPMGDPLPLPYDWAHKCRVLRYLIAAWELTGCPLMARWIGMLAEDAMLASSPIGPAPAHGYTPPNLRNWQAWATAHPQQGNVLEFGRILGWMGWAVGMGARVKKNARHVQWADAFQRCFVTSAGESGFIQRVHKVGVWCDTAHDASQSFEVPLAYLGLFAACHGTMIPFPLDLAVRAGSNLYNGQVPRLNYHGDLGPIHFVDIAGSGGGAMILRPSTGTPTDPANPGDPANAESFIALLCHATGDSKWLDIGARIGRVYASWPAKQAFLETRTDVRREAGLLAMMQQHD